MNNEVTASETLNCRLCASAAFKVFSRKAEDGDEVSLYRCTSCGSLQTETPSWLATEYRRVDERDYINLDVGAANRTIRCRDIVYLLLKIAYKGNSSPRLLDWGGGVGLLVRLLRDIGVDAYLYDKYARNHFATGFEGSLTENYDVITAFEVFEHFPDPAYAVREIFSLDPSMLVVSTSLYKGQGPSWSYLGPPKSEHVFFYSATALSQIGKRFGYNIHFLPKEIAVFYKPSISTARLRLAGLLSAKNRLTELAFTLSRPRYSSTEVDA